jgi:hypothetical protein
LPSPKEIKTELQRESLRYCPEHQAIIFENLQQTAPNNADQEIIFQKFKDAIDDDTNSSSLLMFVQGNAGTGKTNLGKKMLSYARSKQKLSFAIASSGLAANLYENGMTAHGFAQVEVRDAIDLEDDEDSKYHVKCLLSDKPQRLELIKHTRFILWDEFPSNDKEVFHAMYYESAFNEFKGKILICVGDFKQIPPVVLHGSKKILFRPA